MDGGVDIRRQFGLSGETKARQVIITDNGPDTTASAIAAINVAKREYQKQYMDYWNSTAELTGTGRPVDGLFCPLAPHAAVIPGQYGNPGYTVFVNVLDYTSVSIPVTFADKTVDSASANKSVSDLDQNVDWDCECPGRRLLPVI